MIYYRYIAIFLCQFCLLSTTMAQSLKCPPTFKNAQQIPQDKMKRLMVDAQHDPNIRIHQTHISSSNNFNIPSSKDGAIIVFAVVGLVLIIAWVPYAISYLYNLSMGDNQYCPWYRVILRHKALRSNGPELGIKRRAEFNSLQLGVASLSKQYSSLGLSFELGHHRITDEVDHKKENFNGNFFLLGPSLTLGGPDSQLITLDLLGGGSTHQNISLIGEATINWNINLNKHAQKIAPVLNFNFGGHYLDIQENEGIIKNIEQYSLFWGIGLGLIF